ncbi:efflux RND transporter periplasmic adaptor subunit [Candidatus Palauibacter sp.]|uniref:efflux RND transporter periplasmic adaptor subunit n=1 Tax=Candidatus Palauibacter sp. TaxID=3101350 RepID=UPI003B5C29F8
MKARHWVTLIVLLIAGAAVYGIFMRLTEEEDEGPQSFGDPAADSVAEAVRGTASAAAFATDIWLPVEGAVIQRDTFVLWVTASGRAASIRTAPLHSEVQGPVTAVPVQEGEQVRAGQLVARIDPALYEIRLQRAQGGVDGARADFEDRVLFDDQLPDSARLVRAEQARIRVGLPDQEAQLAEARYELEKTRIVAPFAGRVANLAVAQGSRVNQGDSIATIIDLSQIDIDAEVLHSELPLVEVGREATATFPALRGEVFRGQVMSVNPLIDPETQTARVTVRLSNPEARIVPGMPGNVRIAGRQLPDRTFVAKEAVVERNRRQVVFVFEPSGPGAETGRAQWEYVTLGLENDTEVEIIANPDGDDTFVPEGGELVLVDGHATLTHDAQVQIENHGELMAEETPAASDGSR